MRTMLLRLIWEEEGQTLVEYGVIISLVALVVLTALTALNGVTLDSLKMDAANLG